MYSGPYKKIHHALLNWYKEHSRTLPWRDIGDPYLVWISEVMLQQTQVETVVPYFQKWIQVFPDVRSVANASEEDVLKVWEGLGYYSRARNIKKTAHILIDSHDGQLPEKRKELLSLPGIGDYIAGAIASIAFHQPVPALEANGIRVIARIFNFREEVGRSSSKSVLKENLRKIVEFGEAGNVNQAVMDLGSGICVNKTPACQRCPVCDFCLAYKYGEQNNIPIKRAKKPIPHVEVVAGVIVNGRNVLITKRPADKLLGGMWEFPGGKVEAGESREKALHRELKEELDVEAEILQPIGSYDHAYTHFSVSVYTYRANIVSGIPRPVEVADFKWVEIQQLKQFPMGKVDRLISQDIQKQYLT